MKYKFNGVKPLNKAILANNDLVGAGSWIEFPPGLSQAKLWQDAAGNDAIETKDQDEMRVLPGFGVSANPQFSSQGNEYTIGSVGSEIYDLNPFFRFPSFKLPLNVRFLGRTKQKHPTE